MASEKQLTDVLEKISGDTNGFIAASLVDLDSGMTLAVKAARTDFDFTTPQLLGPRMNSAAPEIATKKGLDHNFVIDGTPGKLRIAARLQDPSGRVLELYTTQPGVQVYSANSVRPRVAKDKGYLPHSAISFQTQHYPDSPNHPAFPSTVLRPGGVYTSTTVYAFSAGGHGHKAAHKKHAK